MSASWRAFGPLRRLRDRAVTFDGDEYQSEHRIIRTGKLHKRAKEKCVGPPVLTRRDVM